MQGKHPHCPMCRELLCYKRCKHPVDGERLKDPEYKITSYELRRQKCPSCRDSLRFTRLEEFYYQCEEGPIWALLRPGDLRALEKVPIKGMNGTKLGAMKEKHALEVETWKQQLQECKIHEKRGDDVGEEGDSQEEEEFEDDVDNSSNEEVSVEEEDVLRNAELAEEIGELQFKLDEVERLAREDEESGLQSQLFRKLAQIQAVLEARPRAVRDRWMAMNSSLLLED